MMTHSLSRIIATGLVSAAGALMAEDWPNWRGPDHNGISKEAQWSSAWPASGPKAAWKARTGEGYSGITVAGGQAFTVGLDRRARIETIYCFDADTGKENWKYAYPTKFQPQFYEGGTSGTPTVDGDNVYFLEQTGRLFCLGARDGKLRWGTDLVAETGAEPGVWGFTSAVLVHGDLLIMNVGQNGAAVNKSTGKVAWKSGRGKNGYATPVPFKQGGKDLVAIFCSNNISAVDPASGSVVWQHPWTTQYDVNAADPVLVGGQYLFISSGYNAGCTLLKLTGNGVQEVWKNRNMRNQFNPSVFLDGYLYGIDGNTTDQATLNCIDAQTGAVKWKQSGVGNGAVLAANGKLIVQTDRGQILVAPASSQGFKPEANAQVLGGKCWITPTLANGKLYARNSRGDLVCLDLGK